jgi:DNA-directed RNA polymerase specialized sigma24 family protein
VTTNADIPLPLDPARPLSRVRPMTVEDELRSQNWEKIQAQLTSFAWKHTGMRSWEHAQDLASEAIANAFERIDGWDPARELLVGYLSRQVVGLATNSRRRKRNTFEVAMRAAVKAHGVRHDDGGKREIDFASADAPTDEVLDQRRLAALYRDRLTQGFAGDEAALAVLALFTSGVDEPAEQVARSGLTLSQIRAARRRIYRHAEALSQELAAELDSEDEPATNEDEEEEASEDSR